MTAPRQVTRALARTCATLVWVASGLCFAALPQQAPSQQATGQPPGPAEPVTRVATDSPGTSSSILELRQVGRDALAATDPVAAWPAFRALVVAKPDDVEACLGLAEVHLLLGRPRTAARYAHTALTHEPANQTAMALVVRCLIRARAFDDAVDAASRYARANPNTSAALLAAKASSLFRVQRIDEASSLYRQVLTLEPRHAEAHLRLGSGLTAPRFAPRSAPLLRAVNAWRAQRPETALRALELALQEDPGHPIAHRLLGEVLFQQKAARTVDVVGAPLLALRSHTASPLTPAGQPVLDLRIEEFSPGYEKLHARRRRVASDAFGLFGSRLPRLLSLGGRHDFLGETERTTDALSRASLRGERTFDGRVWDDVRGVGGLRAATGVEALDDAALFGFDTLVHEWAHQVHFYGLSARDRVQIRALYQAATKSKRFLDYYAATNEAEYFGQGVEAYHSLAKRPGCETTHGHTRFELLRVDPELYALIDRLVDWDVLDDQGLRDAVLVAAIQAALRTGRVEDAVTAVELLSPGEVRGEWMRKARKALWSSRSF